MTIPNLTVYVNRSHQKSLYSHFFFEFEHSSLFVQGQVKGRGFVTKHLCVFYGFYLHSSWSNFNVKLFSVFTFLFQFARLNRFSDWCHGRINFCVDESSGKWKLTFYSWQFPLWLLLTLLEINRWNSSIFWISIHRRKIWFANIILTITLPKKAIELRYLNWDGLLWRSIFCLNGPPLTLMRKYIMLFLIVSIHLFIMIL